VHHFRWRSKGFPSFQAPGIGSHHPGEEKEKAERKYN